MSQRGTEKQTGVGAAPAAFIARHRRLILACWIVALVLGGLSALSLPGLLSGAAVIGGFSSLGGAVAGGLLLGLLETYAGAFFGATFKNLVPFGVLILILLLRPQGLAGASSVRRV